MNMKELYERLVRMRQRGLEYELTYEEQLDVIHLIEVATAESEASTDERTRSTLRDALQ